MTDSAPRTVPAEEFSDLGLDDWRLVGGRIEATFRCDSFAAAGELAARIAGLADEPTDEPTAGTDGAENDATVTVSRPSDVRVSLPTYEVQGRAEADAELPRRITDLVRHGERVDGVSARPHDLMRLELAIDTMDADVIRPFWKAVLGYVDGGTRPDGKVVEIRDPADANLVVWFQQMDEPRPQRNRIHLDVEVPHDVAAARLQAALDAGGRLVDDSHARAFWVLADAEGNEACLCTWQDRNPTGGSKREDD